VVRGQPAKNVFVKCLGAAGANVFGELGENRDTPDCDNESGDQEDSKRPEQ
jgi:hypothetical protein